MCALSWSAAAAGNYAYAPNWTSNVTSPWRPEAFTSDVKLPLFLRPLTTPRARQAWASPKLFFFSA